MAYGPLVSGCIVLAMSMGTAVTSAASTWAQVTRPGERFKLTSSAFGPSVVEAG